MGDPEVQSPKAAILIGKILMGAALITIGMLAKIAIDSNQQKLTTKQIAFKAAIMFAIGFVSFVICDVSGYYKWAAAITPIATMCGENIALWILNNVKTWLDKLNEYFGKKK